MDVSNHLASDLFVWPSPNDSSVSPNVDPKGFLDRSRPDLYLIHADLESGLDVRVTRRFIDGDALHAPKWIVHRPRSMSLNFASVLAR